MKKNKKLTGFLVGKVDIISDEAASIKDVRHVTKSQFYSVLIRKVKELKKDKPREAYETYLEAKKQLSELSSVGVLNCWFKILE